MKNDCPPTCKIEIFVTINKFVPPNRGRVSYFTMELYYNNLWGDIHMLDHGIVHESTRRSNMCSAKVFGAVCDCQVENPSISVSYV